MFLIDTNIFLEVMLGRPKGQACIQFLNLVKAGSYRAAVTDFSIYSIMIILNASGKLRELKVFLSSLSAYRGLTLYAMSLEDKLAAVEYATERKFDVDDALQYTSAKRLGVEAILSLDRHFDGRDIPRIDPTSSMMSHGGPS